MGISLRMCEVMQYVEYMGKTKEEIQQILEDRNVQDYAFILHDKDEGVKPHYHIAMRFGSSRKSDNIAKWFNIEENFVGRVKGSWKDILKYLTHENAPKKYQYPVEEVITNFDFEIAKQTGGGRKEEIINMIADGQIREYNIHNKLSAIEYDKYKRNIENAFTYRQKRLLERKEREMECIFITGESGSGKTTYAKRLCEKKGYSYFISGSGNDPFDGYLGQDAIILDDLRGSVFSFADLLKITDNHTSSMVKSRYKNKILECKLLIITSVLKISEFYSSVFESSEEPLVQFERRMQTYVLMSREKMKIFYYDSLEHRYIPVGEFANPCLSEFLNRSNSEERLNFISDIFGDDILGGEFL